MLCITYIYAIYETIFLIQHKILNIYTLYTYSLCDIYNLVNGLNGEYSKSENNFEYKTFYIKFKVKTIYF